MCSSNTQPFQLGTMPLIPPSNTERSFAVRKGAWTKEEDDLLKKCINKHGEGNWHQVPHKAGLNRCRKSCRLRWLNYLRPNIKRGEFMSDEVDLIVRMHKLLGNRWSLIAGRIPGRTANDIKNYWNTHLNKKLLSPCNKLKLKLKPDIKIMNTSKVVKPHPRTFSKNSQWLRRIGNSTETTLSEKMPSKSPTELLLDQSEQWWKSILSEEEKEKMGISSSVIESGEDLITSYCVEGVEPQNTNGGNIFIEEGKNDWDDLYLNMNLWGFLEPEQETMM